MSYEFQNDKRSVCCVVTAMLEMQRLTIVRTLRTVSMCHLLLGECLETENRQVDSTAWSTCTALQNYAFFVANIKIEQNYLDNKSHRRFGNIGSPELHTSCCSVIRLIYMMYFFCILC